MIKFPIKIQESLRDYKLLINTASRLGGQNMKFINNKGKVLFLKTGSGVSAESLKREFNVLKWLRPQNFCIPEIVNYVINQDNTVYLLISNIEGIAAHKITSLSKKEVLKSCAKILKDFHSIVYDGNHYLRTLDNDLDNIDRCIRLNLIDREKFTSSNNGKGPEEIFSYLKTNKEKYSKNTVVHGDYCMPNIIISKNNCGIIDVGDCGPGDIYKDLSAMEVSIRRNFGKKWISMFYNYYNPDLKRNQIKVKYYQYIDQFGYHLNIEKYKDSIGLI